MTTTSNAVKLLRDYQAPCFTIEQTNLVFELEEDCTIVTAILKIKVVDENNDLSFDGEELTLLSLTINEQKIDLTSLIIEPTKLHIPKVVWQKFGNELQIITKVKIYPDQNTQLSGLYKSKGIFCTQCESEGFRRITYYLDRPDVLAIFTVKLIADINLYPTLLAGGNLLDKGELENNKHFATYQDPFKKPSYLFAIVAGSLYCKQDTFVTMSGKKITLMIHAQNSNKHKCDFALAVIKRAMSWDEKIYQREYDLDTFHMVAIDDFNSGAMENKGLNIFNAEAILANTDTTTDAQFMRIEAIIAHEYFHNYSGNRVTCRDWFQLSLKEGFTVLREAQYMADTYSHGVRRIDDAVFMRSHQFAEDAGNLAHAVRPESYEEISNFYTATVYEKGAEVVNMLVLLLGKNTFLEACNLYFSKYDGQAVRVEEFIGCMEEVGKTDLSQFMHWYSQAGTPEVKLQLNYMESKKQLIITSTQSCRSTAECQDKLPFVIPMKLQILDKTGNSQKITCVVLQNKQDEFVLDDITSEPIVSAFNDFSAPVKWQVDQLVANDVADETISLFAKDEFAKWDSSRKIAYQAIVASNAKPLDAIFSNWLTDAIQNPTTRMEYMYFFALPSIQTLLLNHATNFDVSILCDNLGKIKTQLGVTHTQSWEDLYNKCQQQQNNKLDFKQAMSINALQAHALEYLLAANYDNYSDLAVKQFAQSKHMTGRLNALRLMLNYGNNAKDAECLLHEFYEKYQDDAIVLAQWFRLQASMPTANPQSIASLLKHPQFVWTNPNLLRAILGAYSQNYSAFHLIENNSYEFFATQISKIDAINSKMAARMAIPLTQWHGLDANRKELMRQALQGLLNTICSLDLSEIVHKSLSV